MCVFITFDITAVPVYKAFRSNVCVVPCVFITAVPITKLFAQDSPSDMHQGVI